jgi:predicted SAM-dependent methyltransferase
MVEHLYRDEAEFVFREVRRVLRHGGVFRINVPDLQVTIDKFNQGETEAALDMLFERRRSDEKGWYSRHRYLYDYDLLRRLLAEAGFQNIERCSRGKGLVPNLDLLEQRSPTGLYVEAIK